MENQKLRKESYLETLPILKLAYSQLKGQKKRDFLGRLVLALGYRGQSLVNQTLNASRDTIRKGILEVRTGKPTEDKFSERGRKTLETLQPQSVRSIVELLDNTSQIDPKFRSERLYTN
ncbi:MAG: hypothetical protein ACI976_001188 [Aureispira sp.]|jgi:hypothetical protein